MQDRIEQQIVVLIALRVLDAKAWIFGSIRFGTRYLHLQEGRQPLVCQDRLPPPGAAAQMSAALAELGKIF